MSFLLRSILLCILVMPVTGYGETQSFQKDFNETVSVLKSDNVESILAKKDTLIPKKGGGTHVLQNFYNAKYYDKKQKDSLTINDLKDWVALGINLNVFVSDGVYLASIISSTANAEQLEYLRSQGMDFSIVSKNGLSPMNIALMNKNISAIKYLIPYADLNAPLVIEGFSLQYPLNKAVLSHPDLVPAMVKAGANVNGGDSVYRPLFIAAQESPDLVPFLIDVGADVNLQAEKFVKGYSALHAAIQFNPHLIPILLKAGADVNASFIFPATGQEVSALLLASMYSCDRVEKLLTTELTNINFVEKRTGGIPLMFVLGKRFMKLKKCPLVFREMLKNGASLDFEDANGDSVRKMVYKDKAVAGYYQHYRIELKIKLDSSLSVTG